MAEQMTFRISLWNLKKTVLAIIGQTLHVNAN
jgi:hypothetical protein